MFYLLPVYASEEWVVFDLVDAVGAQALAVFHCEQSFDEIPSLRGDHTIAIPDLRPLYPEIQDIIEHLLDRLSTKRLLAH